MSPRTNPAGALALVLAVSLNVSAAEAPTSPVQQAPSLPEPAVLASAARASRAGALPVGVTENNGIVSVVIGGKPFTEYHAAGAPRPYCYPVFGPGGAAMTRNFPMKNVPGEDTDHPHHRGMWFGHQRVNGQNFWIEKEGAGKIVHRRFAKLSGGLSGGEIVAENDWIGGDGRQVCSDVRTLRFSGDARTRIADWEVTIQATHGDVVLGDDKDGLMAVRVAESMRALKLQVKGQPPEPGDGHIVLSTGVRDDGASVVAAKKAKREAQTWGKSAEWCYYYGPLDGKTVGVAIFDHPQNPRFPTWWHVRDYGLFAANPLGQHYFENKPAEKNLGDLKIPAGGSVTFRYRVVFAEGDDKAADVAGLHRDFKASIPKN